MTDQTPLNEDAIEAGRKAYRRAYYKAGDSLARCFEKGLSAYLAVAQPVVNSVEELDALPIGSVVIINGTMLQADDRDDYGTMWSRVRDIDAYPSEALALPARVLYRPEVGE